MNTAQRPLPGIEPTWVPPPPPRGTIQAAPAWPADPNATPADGDPAVFRFVIPGEPVPCGRPRVFVAGKRAIATTPPKTRSYETRVRETVRALLPPSWRADWGAYAITIDVHRAERRGDTDNYAKSTLDSLQPHVFANDSAVRRLVVELHDDLVNPRLEVEVRLMGALDAEAERKTRTRSLAKRRRPAKKGTNP